MNRFLENLIEQAEENPIVALGVGAGLITAISKLLDSGTARKNSRSWDRETKRREAKVQK